MEANLKEIIEAKLIQGSLRSLIVSDTISHLAIVRIEHIHKAYKSMMIIQNLHFWHRGK